jgi:hypothetical protein
VDFLDVHLPALTTKYDMHAAIAIPHTGRADLLDPGFDPGLIVPTGFVVVGGRVDFENPAGPPDRYVPITTNRIDQLALASRP